MVAGGVDTARSRARARGRVSVEVFIVVNPIVLVAVRPLEFAQISHDIFYVIQDFIIQKRQITVFTVKLVTLKISGMVGFSWRECGKLRGRARRDRRRLDEKNGRKTTSGEVRT